MLKAGALPPASFYLTTAIRPKYFKFWLKSKNANFLKSYQFSDLIYTLKLLVSAFINIDFPKYENDLSLWLKVVIFSKKKKMQKWNLWFYRSYFLVSQNNYAKVEKNPWNTFLSLPLLVSKIQIVKVKEKFFFSKIVYFIENNKEIFFYLSHLSYKKFLLTWKNQ